MSFCRCFMFGIGQNACRRLVQGLATVSKGTAEFLADGERLQPKVALPSFSSSRHSNVINNPSNLTSSEIISQTCQGLYSWVRERMVWCDLYLRAFFVILTAQMIKSLKKTTSLVLSDISIEWLFPETKEVLLSPVGNTFLFPGDSLISYAVVCDTTRYHSNPKSVSAKTAHYCIHHICFIFDFFFHLKVPYYTHFYYSCTAILNI